MRLLVLEDEPALRETLSQQFRAAGFAIDAAADGVEGEFVYPSAPVGGTLTNLAVTRGATVAAGQLLFELEAEAAARSAGARSTVA